MAKKPDSGVYRVVTKLDVRLDEGGKIAQFRTRLSLSFKYEG